MTGGESDSEESAGSILVHADGGTATWGAGECTARQVRGSGQECVWIEDTCRAGKPCESVTHALSCGLPGDGCGRPVRCLCH